MKTTAQLDKEIRGLELGLTQRFKEYGDAGFADAQERRDWTDKIMECSGGKNTVVWINDGADKYFPSVMFRMAAAQNDVLPGQDAKDVHPAFRYSDATIIPMIGIGKYQGYKITSNSKTMLLSLRGMDPSTEMTIDQAVAYCRANGDGHHCVTNAEWAYLALQAKAEGFYPEGNTYFNRAGDRGTPAYKDGTYGIGRILTGSGPITFAHDGSPFGVFDMTGNINEWTPGLRLNDAEVNVIPYNDAARATTDLSASSTEWKGVDASNAFVESGTTGLVYGTDITLPASGGKFKDIADSVVRLQELGVTPFDAETYGEDGVYYVLTGERVTVRSGSWNGGSLNGLFILGLTRERSYSSGSIGARPAYMGNL